MSFTKYNTLLSLPSRLYSYTFEYHQLNKNLIGVSCVDEEQRTKCNCVPLGGAKILEVDAQDYR
jgi:hypothetical protein